MLFEYAKRLMPFYPASIILIFVTLLAHSSWTNAPVWHESSQLLAGLNIWKFGRFDTQSVNPPLIRAVASLPVFFLSPNHDKNKFDRPPVDRNEFHLASIFVKDNGDQARIFFFVGRLACIVFSIVGIIFCYRFAKDLFGTTSGMPPANVPQPGWYAVSVNYIYDRSGQYRYFLHFEPVARTGYSIYIYYMTQEDVERYNFQVLIR